MIIWMKHLDGQSHCFFFSPMSWWTSLQNSTDKLPERVSLIQLYNEGWREWVGGVGEK